MVTFNKSEMKSVGQSEPLLSHEVSERPWQIVSSDLCEVDSKHYLVTPDHYSDFYEIDQLQDTGGKM